MTLGKWCYEGNVTADLFVFPKGKPAVVGSVYKGLLDEKLNRFYYAEIDQVIMMRKYIYCLVEEDARE